MKSSLLGRIQMEMALQGFNPLWGLVLLCACVAGLIWGMCLPDAKRELTAQLHDMESLRSQQMQAPIALPPESLAQRALGQDFQSVLGQVSAQEHYLGTLLSLAQAIGMDASNGEYKLACEAEASLCRLRIRLPMRGSYLQIRTFVEQGLLELPFAGLDELSLRRDGIGTDEIEAGLTFSLYLAYPKQGIVAAKEGAS